MENVNVTINNSNYNLSAVFITFLIFAVGIFIIIRYIFPFLPNHLSSKRKDDGSTSWFNITQHSRMRQIIDGAISAALGSILAGLFLSYGPIGPSATPTPIPTVTPSPILWSEWSDWTTDVIESSSNREVEKRQRREVTAYNMVHYGTQQDTTPYYRMFRDYSIQGNFQKYHARVSYDEKHLTRKVSALQMELATSYPPNGDFIILSFGGETYEGFQMGNSIAYNFGDDNKVWFIESEEYTTVNEYRYRYLMSR